MKIIKIKPSTKKRKIVEILTSKDYTMYIDQTLSSLGNYTIYHCKLFNNSTRQFLGSAQLNEDKLNEFYLANLFTTIQNHGFGTLLLQMLFQADICSGKRIRLSFSKTSLRTHFYRKNMDGVFEVGGYHWCAIKDC